MRVAPGIYRAESNNEVVYALDCGGAYALVDVGGKPGFPAKLSQLEADGVDPTKITALFVTHSHDDHAGAVPQLCADCSPRVFAHRLACERLRYCPASTPIDPDLVDYTVDEGDTVEIGDLVLQVYHLPGHTPDSIAWQFGDSLFVGDVIFCDGGIGWMDVHWGSCVSDYRASLQRLLRIKATSIYPGHRTCGPITRETIEGALRHLNALAEADGSPLAAIGRPAPRRGAEDPAKIIRLSIGLPSQ